MKKSIYSSLLAFTMLIAVVSCKKATPITERIKKAWSVQSVKENGTLVYTKGGTANKVPGYAKFSLNLLSPPTFTMREVDDNSFSGQYLISGADDKLGTGTLSLKGISPVPTGSNGTIDLTITSITAVQMVLVRSSTNPKTGATSTEYTLVTP